MRDYFALVGLLIALVPAIGMRSQTTDARGNTPAEVELATQTLLWELAPDVYDGYIMFASNPLTQCIEAALLTCGAGRVCSVTVVDNSCSFTCQDASGECPGPEPEPDTNDFSYD